MYVCMHIYMDQLKKGSLFDGNQVSSPHYVLTQTCTSEITYNTYNYTIYTTCMCMEITCL